MGNLTRTHFNSTARDDESSLHCRAFWRQQTLAQHKRGPRFFFSCNLLRCITKDLLYQISLMHFHKRTYKIPPLPLFSSFFRSRRDFMAQSLLPLSLLPGSSKEEKEFWSLISKKPLFSFFLAFLWHRQEGSGYVFLPLSVPEKSLRKIFFSLFLFLSKYEDIDGGSQISFSLHTKEWWLLLGPQFTDPDAEQIESITRQLGSTATFCTWWPEQNTYKWQRIQKLQMMHFASSRNKLESQKDLRCRVGYRPFLLQL